MIVGLFTKLLDPGGIERISQHTACALSFFAEQNQIPYRIFSLSDQVGIHKLRIGKSDFFFEGFEGNKLKFVWAITKLSREINYVCIGHPNLSPLGLLVKLSNKKCYCLVITYGIDVWNPLALITHLSLKEADTITALSNYTKEMLVSVQKISPEKISLLPPALDPVFLEQFNISSDSTNKLPSSKILLTVARLDAKERYKGIDHVIEAMPKLLEKVPNLTYVIVGDGTDRLRLESIAKKTGVYNNVKFIGAKNSNELLKYYVDSSIFVMPSLKEGFGIVFLEAMAAGKPVIGGNHGGIPDLIKNDINGYLVEYGNVEMLTEKLVKLLQNDNLCKQMGNLGKELVSIKYTFENYQKKFIELLKRGA